MNGTVWNMNSTTDWPNATEQYNATSPDGWIGKHTVARVVFIILIAAILMVSTVGGNLLVIIAYRVNRKLRSVNNLFLVSLACSDLVIGFVSMNLYPVIIIMGGKWPLGEVACDIWLCIDYTLSMASVANLMLICLDRYFSVTRPFTYRRKRTRVRAKGAIILAWVFSLLLWSPAIMIWPRVHERTVEADKCYIQFFENPVITSVTAILAFYLPVLIMIILYWRIFMETRRCHQYMEYLKSYRVSHIKSPFVKRKATAQTSAPPVSAPAPDASPRCRVNSTPSTSFRAISPTQRLEPLQENTREPAYGKIMPCARYSDNRKDGGEVRVHGSRSTSLQDVCSSNNNHHEDTETAPRLSHFQRFKRSIVSSIRNSLKSTGSDCTSKEELKTGGNREIRDAASGFDDQPNDKRETAALLVQETANGVSNAPVRKNPSASSNSLRSRDIVVPIIVTSHESIEQRPHNIARRTRSEPEGLSLTVPRERLPTSESRSNSSGANKILSSDRKAARTLSAILLAFVVTWLPYNVCVLCSSFYMARNPDQPDIVPEAVWQFAYYLCYINSTMNPFCYAACNKTFRDTFVRLLTCRRRGSRSTRCRCRRSDGRRGRDRHMEPVTAQTSTSSSHSVPPSPDFRRRKTSST